MAQYNEILTGRYNRFLQKLFSMKGRPPAPQLSGDIQTNLNFFSGAENRYLESWNRFAFTVAVPLAAGQTSTSRLRNPANSGVIVVFERIACTGAQDSPVLEQQATGADLAVTAFPANLRLDSRGSPTSILIRSENTVGTPSVSLITKFQIGYTANNTGDFLVDTMQEWTLLPGDAIQVRSGVVAQNIIVSWLWRERVLEESEKT